MRGTSERFQWSEAPGSFTLCIRCNDRGDDRWKTLVFKHPIQRREPHVENRMVTVDEAYETLVAFPPNAGGGPRWHCVLLDDGYYVECLCDGVEVADASSPPAPS
jgi:hypothetical protein